MNSNPTSGLNNDPYNPNGYNLSNNSNMNKDNYIGPNSINSNPIPPTNQYDPNFAPIIQPNPMTPPTSFQ